MQIASNLANLTRIIDCTLGLVAIVGHHRSDLVAELGQFLALRISYAILMDKVQRDRVGRRQIRTRFAAIHDRIRRDQIDEFIVICDDSNNIDSQPISVTLRVKFATGVRMEIVALGFNSHREWSEAWDGWKQSGGSSPIAGRPMPPVDLMAITRSMIEGTQR